MSKFDSNLLYIEDFLYSERIEGNSAAIKVIIFEFLIGNIITRIMKT